MSDPWVIGLTIFWTAYVCFFVGLGARVLGRAHRRDDEDRRNSRAPAPVVVSERLTTRTVRRPRL